MIVYNFADRGTSHMIIHTTPRLLIWVRSCWNLVSSSILNSSQMLAIFHFFHTYTHQLSLALYSLLVIDLSLVLIKKKKKNIPIWKLKFHMPHQFFKTFFPNFFYYDWTINQRIRMERDFFFFILSRDEILMNVRYKRANKLRSVWRKKRFHPLEWMK